MVCVSGIDIDTADEALGIVRHQRVEPGLRHAISRSIRVFRNEDTPGIGGDP